MYNNKNTPSDEYKIGDDTIKSVKAVVEKRKIICRKNLGFIPKERR